MGVYVSRAGGGALSLKSERTGSADWRDNVSFNKKNKFFGDINQVTNKYFEIKSQNPSADEAIVFTDNVAFIKGNPVLITGNNKGVYLKEWNILQASLDFPDESGHNITNTFAVKINKKYYKEYTFKSNFDGVSFDKDETFNSLKKLATEQEKQRKRVSVKSGIIGRNGFIK